MMKTLWEESLHRFRERVAAATPTPGGGAVAAVTAAFAAALLRMICGIMVAKRGTGNFPERELEALVARVQACEDRLAQCAEEDILAFDAYMAARKIGGSGADPATKQSLLAACAQVPLDAAEQVKQLQSLCGEIEAAAPSWLASDLATASHLLEASRVSLLANVAINLKDLEDGTEREALQRDLERLR